MENGTKNRKLQFQKPLLILFGFLAAMGVAYAILTQVLTIGGSTTVQSGTWDVQINPATDMTKFDTENSKYIAEGDGSIQVHSGDTTATVTTKLTVPGARAVYDLSVENKGSINAVLDATNPVEITPNNEGFTSMNIAIYEPANVGDDEEGFLDDLCATSGGGYDATSSYADSGGLMYNDNYKLAASASKMYKVVVWWNSTDESVPASSIATISSTIKLNYVQDTTAAT